MKVDALIYWLHQHANPDDEVFLDVYIEDGGSFECELGEQHLQAVEEQKRVFIKVDA